MREVVSNFEKWSTVGKMLLNSIACYREVICEKEESIDATNFIIILEMATATPHASNHHTDQSAADISHMDTKASTSKKIRTTLMVQMILNIFFRSVI